MKQKTVGIAALSVPKKLLSILLSLCMLFSVFATFGIISYAKAYSGKLNSKISWSIDKADKTLFIDGKGKLPKTNNIGLVNKFWGDYVDVIETVYIGEGITNISSGIFDGMKIKYVFISSTVESIDDCAFYDCFELKSINIPKNVKRIEDGAFVWSDVKDFYFEGSKTEWANRFDDWEKLRADKYWDFNPLCNVSYSVIHYKSIVPAKIELEKEKFTYNGNNYKSAVTAYDINGNTIKPDYYTVHYEKDRKSVGNHKVTITFKDKCSGTMTAYYKIIPDTTRINSVTHLSKGFKVKWKKQSKQTTGYQIEYSTDKKFKKNTKTITIKKNTTTSKKITNLSAKKKYYVRVRTYKTVNGKKYYSAWSASKSVTTKK